MRDSNPRSDRSLTCFRGRLLQPLGQLTFLFFRPTNLALVFQKTYTFSSSSVKAELPSKQWVQRRHLSRPIAETMDSILLYLRESRLRREAISETILLYSGESVFEYAETFFPESPSKSLMILLVMRSSSLLLAEKLMKGQECSSGGQAMRI